MDKNIKLIYKKIKEYDDIVIVRHENSDLDALGSQFGLASWIKDNFPNKRVYCLGENHSKYTKNFIPKSDEFNDLDKEFLGICLDVNQVSRVSMAEVFDKASYKICIDHHIYKDINEFDLVYIDPDAMACAQVIASLLFMYKKKINRDCCKYLYAGIDSDSGGFFYLSTNYKTLEIASKLLKIGDINPYNDIHYLVSMKSLQELKNSAYLTNKLVVNSNGFAYIVNEEKDLKEMKISAHKANEMVYLFNRVEEIGIVIIASECENKLYRCSIRSKKVAINEVCRKYDGGGHALSGGVKNITRETLEKVKIDLDNLLK